MRITSITVACLISATQGWSFDWIEKAKSDLEEKVQEEVWDKQDEVEKVA